MRFCFGYYSGITRELQNFWNKAFFVYYLNHKYNNICTKWSSYDILMTQALRSGITIVDEVKPRRGYC